MRLNYFIFTAFIATMVCSCSNLEDLSSGKTVEGTISATMEKKSTSRAGFTAGDAQFYWSKGDKIGVTTSNNKTSFTPLKLISNHGEANGTFKGSFLEGTTIEGYAVHPYNDKNSLSSTILSYYFPTSYNYDKVDADITTEVQGEGNSFNPAMWGKIQNSSVGFKHLGGVFCIKITPLPIGNDLKLILSTDKKINGTFTTDLSADTPVIEATASTNDSEKNVSIIFSNSTENTSGVFYIPVPTATYNNVTVKVLDGDKEDVDIVCGTYTIDRRTLQYIGITTGSITSSETVTVNDPGEVANALTSGKTNLAITGTVSGETTVEIPKIQEPETPVNLSLQNIGDNVALTVSDASSEFEPSVEKLTISIPNVEEEKAPNVAVSMPNTTIILSSNGGTATYNEVKAETADETLIVDNGVTIKNVIVKKGNIEIKNGGVIEHFERDAENTSVVIVYADSKPNNLPEGFTYGGSLEASSLKKAMKNGGTYTLNEDVNITSANITIPEGISSTLDLNGHTITAVNNKVGRIYVLGEFTLKDNARNGKIVTSKDNNINTGIIIIEGENAKMTMESGNINTVLNDPATKGQYGIGILKGGDFTMTGGTIEAGWYAISGNGGDQTGNSVININGGTLVSAADYAMYLPQSGTTTINGGTVKGACGAIGQRSGEIIINGGTFIAEGTGNTGEWKEGTGSMGNAVINMACGEANAYGNCTTTINGGTFTAEGNAVVLAKTAKSKKTNRLYVKGGTFSDLEAIKRIVENANINIILNKDFEINSMLTISKDGATVSLDLNNHKIINQTTDYYKRTVAFKVISKGGTLNIKGEGRIECIGNDEIDCARMAIWASYGTVNISGGYFYNYQKSNKQLDLIYATNKGVINISGGTFESRCKSDTQYWVLNQLDSERSTSKINVTGGTFKNFNPAKNLSETENTSFVADGYKVMCEGVEATTIHDINGGDKIYTVVRK